MEKETATVEGLILEQDPSDKMVETAERKGELMYIWKKELPPNYYPKITNINSTGNTRGEHIIILPPNYDAN